MVSLNFHSAAFGRVLNYVWVNKEPFARDDKKSCGVPLHYLDHSIANAKRYSDTQVDVWLDNSLLDQSSIDMAARHLAASGASNIHLRNLNDIPSFHDLKSTLLDHTRDIAALRAISPEEQTFEHHNIWGRVDLARLLVLQHSLEKSGVHDVIYSDFDATDVFLDDPKAQTNLEKYGMAFGLAPSSTTGKYEVIENGYLAFRRDRMDKALFDRILSETKKEVAAGYNGYGPFYQELKAWCEDRKIPNFPAAISIPLLPSMRYEIPKSEQKPNASL